MNITLRKAAALQNAINDVIKNINIASDVTINEFQDAEQEINKAASTLSYNLLRVSNLYDILFEIRSAVGVANQNAGINTKLAQIARWDRTIQLYTGLSGRTERVSATVLAGQLEKIKNRPADSRANYYGLADTVNTSVLTTEQLADYRALLNKAKKEKQRLQDEILELNVRTDIVLSSTSVSFLQTEGLI